MILRIFIVQSERNFYDEKMTSVSFHDFIRLRITQLFDCWLSRSIFVLPGSVVMLLYQIVYTMKKSLCSLRVLKFNRSFVPLMLGISLLLGSCSGVVHRYYWQSPHQVDLFKGKNEFHAGAGYTADSGDLNGFNAEGSYALTNFLSLGVNYMSYRAEAFMEESTVKPNWYKGNYLDGSLSLYKNFKSFWIAELRMGVGTGSQQHYYTEIGSMETWFLIPITTFYTYSVGNSQLNYVKSFIQPSIGMRFKNFQCALSARAAHLYYNHVDNEIVDGHRQSILLDKLSDNRSSILFEPALTVRAGFRQVKFQFQLAGSFMNSKASLPIADVQMNIGMHLTLGGKNQDKKIREQMN